MKKLGLIIICILVLTLFISCGSHDKVLKKGDVFTITGMVDYSDEPSDIGQNYCSITGALTIEYLYTDIYEEESKWSSNVFYTKGKDTILLKKYIGQQVTVSGVFDAESHGIPYITNIDILQ